MNETKQQVLVKALALFNAEGISNVSLRTIADEVGISVGNLQYHFKKREDIIESLYFQLVDQIDGISFIPSEDLLKSSLDLSMEVFKTLFEYHFFLLDFVAITRKNKKIKRHYSELSKRRELEFLGLVDLLVENGIFREELLKNEYKNLFKRMEISNNFWFSSILIQADVLTEKSVEAYANFMSQGLFPYLTYDGKNRYAAIYPNQ